MMSYTSTRDPDYQVNCIHLSTEASSLLNSLGLGGISTLLKLPRPLAVDLHSCSLCKSMKCLIACLF